jgi:hypothetical membrane protein
MKTFADRYPLAGPVLWILSIQYFIIQVVAAWAWTNGYSWRLNTISDLGNMACGVYGGRYVCSPLHALMNTSLIALGITMILGSLLISRQFKDSGGAVVGFSCMAISGLGSMMVGLFPENGVAALHIAGAALSFFVGNVGLIVLSLSLPVSRSLKIYTFLSGALALAALGLFLSHSYLGLGEGGMERIVAYPQTVWLVIFGIYTYSNQTRKRYNKAIK